MTVPLKTDEEKQRGKCRALDGIRKARLNRSSLD